MAFDGHYLEWNQRRIKGIIDFYGYKFMYGKTILDLGCGYADISGVLHRLGAQVTAVDAREDHLKMVSKKFSNITTVKADLDRGWPFQGQFFDLTLDLGLLCHLSDFKTHLQGVCGSTTYLVLETAVCDSDDPNICHATPEHKGIYDRSANGMGCRPSVAAIEQVLTDCGMEFQRIDSSRFNAPGYEYDWRATNGGNMDFHRRRIWFAVKKCNQVKYSLPIDLNAQATSSVNANAVSLGNAISTNTISAQNVSVVAAQPVPAHRGTLPRLLPHPYSLRAQEPRPDNEVDTMNREQREEAARRQRANEEREELDRQARSARAAQERRNNRSTDPVREIIEAPSVVPSASRVRLFYHYYDDKNINRKQEIDLCLQKNINNPRFDIIVLDSPENPTFDFFIQRINQLVGPNDISIFCRPDIFFDDSIGFVNRLRHKEIFAINHWDWQPNGSPAILLENPNVQDVWIIKGKIEGVNGDFPIDMKGAEGRIAFEFQQAGYKIINPARTIKAYHHHSSGVRIYSDEECVPGPYLPVEITGL